MAFLGALRLKCLAFGFQVSSRGVEAPLARPSLGSAAVLGCWGVVGEATVLEPWIPRQASGSLTVFPALWQTLADFRVCGAIRTHVRDRGPQKVLENRLSWQRSMLGCWPRQAPKTFGTLIVSTVDAVLAASLGCPAVAPVPKLCIRAPRSRVGRSLGFSAEGVLWISSANVDGLIRDSSGIVAESL